MQKGSEQSLTNINLLKQTVQYIKYNSSCFWQLCYIRCVLHTTMQKVDFFNVFIVSQAVEVTT